MRPDDEAWRLRRQWEFGKRFLYRWNDADRLFFRSRAAIALLACALAASVFSWTRRHWGLSAASLALLISPAEAAAARQELLALPVAAIAVGCCIAVTIVAVTGAVYLLLGRKAA